MRRFLTRTRVRTGAPAGTALLALAIGLAVAGCGSSRVTRADHPGAVALHGKPQVVQPVAGIIPGSSGESASAGVSGAGPVPGSAGEVSVTPSAGAKLAKPESTAEVEQELTSSGISSNPDRATLTASGLAIAPANAPPQVVAAIQAANQIAELPYIWGGGHAEYEDTGYDCSGSLSFILAAAGLLNGTETSGEFMSYGDAGLGKWITIYAMNGHTFAYIAGLRFDTVALAETGTRWSNRAADEPNLSSFVARHPVGL